MSEEEKQWNKRDKPTFIMIPRKFIITIVTGFVVLLIGNIASIQWSNYVDQRSNLRWCGVVKLIDEGNAANPPPTERERNFATEITSLRKVFRCK